MNNELQFLTDWFRANKISLNESKTKLLIFRPPRKLNITVPNIKLNNFILTPEKTDTCLGIETDENLSWNKQIEILAKILSRTNGLLLKLSYYVSKKTLTSIYYILFQSYIVYGSTVWSFTSQKNMNKIFVLQKKCTRLLTFSDYGEHTSPIFKYLKVLKLQDIIKFSILKFIYFYFNDQLPLQVKNIFIKNESVNLNNTRGGKLLFIPHINTTHFSTKSLRYNGPLTWNNFSQSMNNNNFVNLAISKFKKFLKDLILENYY